MDGWSLVFCTVLYEIYELLVESSLPLSLFLYAFLSLSCWAMRTIAGTLSCKCERADLPWGWTDWAKTRKSLSICLTGGVGCVSFWFVSLEQCRHTEMGFGATLLWVTSCAMAVSSFLPFLWETTEITFAETAPANKHRHWSTFF